MQSIYLGKGDKTHRRYISPSEIASLDCWRAYRWKREGLQPIQRFDALSYGIAWDAFIQEWYKPIDLFGSGSIDTRSLDERYSDALANGVRTLEEDAKRVDAALLERNMPLPQDWHETREEHNNLLAGMAEHFATLPSSMDASMVCRESQVQVKVPLPSQTGKRRSVRFWMHGIIDRVMENMNTGGLVLVDDKTTKRLNADFEDSFEDNLQMPLYAWALKQLGYSVEQVMISAAAKQLPYEPTLLAREVAVLDENGNPVTRPMNCDACNGSGIINEGVVNESGIPPMCNKCNGFGVAKFLSGARKGEVKTEKVTRPALRSVLSDTGKWNVITTERVMLNAIHKNNLNESDYKQELEALRIQDKEASPFFRTFGIQVTPLMIQEAEDILVTIAPMLDKVPDVPMRNSFRCRGCVFKRVCRERDQEAREELIATMFTTREQREESKQKIQNGVSPH